MTKLQWHELGQRPYEAGVDRGVLYISKGNGIPWNGLISVNENDSGLDTTTNYVDGIRINARHIPDAYAATIEAYTYPDELDESDDFRVLIPTKTNKRFGLTYRTKIIDGASGSEVGYKIHLVYNAFFVPAQRTHSSMNDKGTDALSLSWNVSTTPIPLEDLRPSAHMIVDTSMAYPSTVEALENMLYGSEQASAFLPQPNEVMNLFQSSAILRITNHGDGTWTAEGPDDAVRMTSDTEFEINWPSVVYVNDTYYEVSSR